MHHRAVDHDQVFGIELVDQLDRLGGNDQLVLLLGCRLHQAAQHADGERVQAQLRLVDQDRRRHELFRLQQYGGQTDEAQGAVRQGAGGEWLVLALFGPFELDLFPVVDGRAQVEIAEEGRHQADSLDDTAVVLFVMVLQTQ
jgi:hypothetical protein